jgi:type I restriction enzyme, S subunit
MTLLGGSRRGSGWDQSEYRSVGDAFQVLATGRGVNRTEYSKGTLIPIVDQGMEVVAGYTDDVSFAVEESEYVVFGDHTRAVKWVDFKFAPGADGTKVLRAAPGVEPKFGYYALANLDVPSRGYNRHWTVVRDMRIPVPPLEVQREIVRILDNFTELEMVLEAELDARRQQYNYYRDLLLSPAGAELQSVPLNQLVANVSSGRNKSRSDGGDVPVFGSTGLIGYTGLANYSGDSLLVARVGANAGLVNAVSGEYDVSDNTIIIIPKENWDIRFAFHQLVHKNINQFARGGGQPLITGAQLKSLVVWLPPIEKQRKIAAVLDKFDALVNDLSIGLPAELAARRKQYEYYRDKLLTFEEAHA